MMAEISAYCDQFTRVYWVRINQLLLVMPTTQVQVKTKPLIETVSCQSRYNNLARFSENILLENRFSQKINFHQCHTQIAQLIFECCLAIIGDPMKIYINFLQFISSKKLFSFSAQLNHSCSILGT